MIDNPEGNQTSAGTNGPAFCFSVLAFGLALFLASQMGSQVKWSSGRTLYSQPGFWPVMAVCGMLLFGAFELFFSYRRTTSLKAGPITAEFSLWLRAFEFVGWFLIYVVSVPRLGYLPCTLIFSTLLTFRLGYRSVKAIGSALLLATATVVIFKSFLSVKIPGGQVYEFLPSALRNFMIIYL